MVVDSSDPVSASQRADKLTRAIVVLMWTSTGCCERTQLGPVLVSVTRHHGRRPRLRDGQHGRDHDRARPRDDAVCHRVSTHVAPIGPGPWSRDGSPHVHPGSPRAFQEFWRSYAKTPRVRIRLG